MKEYTDIADTAWASNPLTDPELITVRDNVRRQVGTVLRSETGRGDGRVIAASWIGMALAAVDSLDLEDLREYVNVLPPSFGSALQAACLAGRLADHHGKDRDWLARNLVADLDAHQERYRHATRGTVYNLVGVAELQDAAGNGIHESARIAVYQGEDGKLWAREDSEFRDGRFEKVGK